MSAESLRALPRPLAFVLPGGGALGAYQVGVLRALAEHEITADLFVGVSAGALNAAYLAWSSGLDGIAALEQIWRSVRRRDLLRVHPGRVGAGVHRPAGVVPRQPPRCRLGAPNARRPADRGRPHPPGAWWPPTWSPVGPWR